MSYLIIFTCLALVIGSWMWLMPSPREKALADLRQKAINKGFQPKFVNLESYQSLIGKELAKAQGKPESQIVRYSKQGKDKTKVKDSRNLWVFSPERTILSATNLETGDPLSEEAAQAGLALAEILSGLLALEVQDDSGRRRLSFYWLEQGDLSNVTFDSEQLEALQNLSF